MKKYIIFVFTMFVGLISNTFAGAGFVDEGTLDYMDCSGAYNKVYNSVGVKKVFILNENTIRICIL